MIILFFLSSWTLLKLEKNGWLYKIMPFMFLITIFFHRQDVDYNSTLGLAYSAKYFAYLKYVFMGYIHFFSMYVFGMFCSYYKDIVIDKFWNWRWVLIPLMLLTSILNVYLGLNYGISNGTVSKIFLTVIVLAYLKHYDEWLISHTRLNKSLDIIAKYSFGIFFIHWYVFFLYNLVLNLPNVMPILSNVWITLGLVFVRFLAVSLMSLFVLWLIKQIILKINPNTNTRSFIGV